MRWMRYGVGGSLLLLCAFVGAACGGDDSESSAGTGGGDSGGTGGAATNGGEGPLATGGALNDGGAGSGGAPPEPRCGDATCDATENCRFCAADCGRCEPTIDCAGTTCSFASCTFTYEGIRFAEDILAQPACAGATLPDWFVEARCFIEQGEWAALADANQPCALMYPTCPCADGFYQWADLSLEFEFWNVDLTDPTAVAALEPVACAESGDEICCTPMCDNRECGPDPTCGRSCGVCTGGEACNDGVCGAGTGDACFQCIESCTDLGLDNCCSGVGCFCFDECQPTSCPAGTELCCGPYGDCLCLADCPY